MPINANSNTNIALIFDTGTVSAKVSLFTVLIQSEKILEDIALWLDKREMILCHTLITSSNRICVHVQNQHIS